MALSVADRNRRHEIINALADLSRKGWAHAQPSDYEPLEAELREIEDKDRPDPRCRLCGGAHHALMCPSWRD